MEFGLSQDQIMLQDSVKRFLSEQYPLDEVRKIASGETTDANIWKGLTELGIPGLLIPEANGGVGLGMLEAAVVAELLGFYATPSPFISTAVIAPVVLLGANKLANGRQEKLLASITTGVSRVGIAFGEALGARDKAGLSENAGKINGTAIFVLDADADEYIVGVKKTDGVSLYLVPSAAVKRQELTTVDKTRTTCELVFDNCEAELISDDATLFSDALNAGRIMLAADSLGAGQNMIDQSVAYAKEREQFDRPIGSFQAVKHMCAEMTAGLEPCRSMVWYAAHAFDELPEEVSVVACQSKAHISEVAKFVAQTATQVHGGMGFTDLIGLHYWFKRIGFNRPLLGSPEYLREQAAILQGLVAA